MKVGFINSIIAKARETFPIGLVSLCTVLGSKNIPCKIIDFSTLKSSEDFNKGCINEFAELIHAEKFSLVSFYNQQYMIL